MAHQSRSYVVTIEEAFNYHKDIERYPLRYPSYCQNVEIIKSSVNTITTKEFWNVSLDRNTDHVAIEVSYDLIQNREIRYQIQAGNMKGIRNRMLFLSSTDKNYKSQVEFALPILDMTGHPISGKRSQVYDNLIVYLRTQDAINLENKMRTYELGQICPKCKNGKLWSRPGDIIGVQNNTRTILNFECDFCHEKFRHVTIVSRDKIDIS